MRRWPGRGSVPIEDLIQRYVYSGRRKDAATVNRDFLRWLSGRGQADRPFFAFLNYIDAHDAYFPPSRRDYRFGLRPADEGDFFVLQNWESIDKTKLPARYRRWPRTVTTTASDRWTTRSAASSCRSRRRSSWTTRW